MKKFSTLFIVIFSCIVINCFAKKTIKVACVGNSVTYGYLLPEREKNSYPGQLQQLLGNGFEVRNFGHSGTTLLTNGHRPYIKEPEFKQALTFKADKVIIHLGLNDTDPRNWPNYQDEFITDYYALIDSFRVANPKAEIWICRMTPIFDRHPRFLAGTRDWHAQIQEVIEKIAANANVGLINLQKPLYHRPDLFADALHPNREGAAILAQTVYGTLTGKWGGLQLPSIYTDHMVMQRRQPLTIFGRADAGESITVKIADRKEESIACADGTWLVTLAPMEAGGPYKLSVSTKNRKLIIDDVMLGEVWLCSGQSNMAFKVKQSVTAQKDMETANESKKIRLFNMEPKWETYAIKWDSCVMDSLNQLKYFHNNGWSACSPQTVSNFSAVAYHFGKMLADSLNVPIGLICNAVGGSPTEAWIDRHTMEYEYPDMLTNWKQNPRIQDWVRERSALNIKNAKNPQQRHPYEPCYLFESGIIPLQHYPIKGIIWYQGESNAHNIEIHEKLFPLLVNSWRHYWNNKDIPFYYVQLSSLNRPSWPLFRDSQRRLLENIPFSGMAVSSDKGDSLDVHPRFKKEIGERLALQALNKSYGFTDVTPSGPLFKSVRCEDGALIVTFDYDEEMHPASSDHLNAFEIAGKNGLFYSAEAEITNKGIRIWSSKVKDPVEVRYGWQPFTRANLVNSSGLPASTFKAKVK